MGRSLHPLAWWGWGIALAVAASRTNEIGSLALLILATLIVTFTRKGSEPWAAAISIGIKIASVALILRMLIAIIFSVPGQGRVLFSLPQIRLPEWLAGIFIGGEVTQERLRFVFLESLTIFALVIALAAASSLANPKQTLRALPGVLHEAGVALIIATTLIPHFAVSVRRIRRARKLRGDDSRFAFKKMMVPLFEEALERALILAESMESRGYGHKPERGGALAPSILMLSAIMMLLISIIQLVIGDSYQLALALAIVTMATGLILGNRRSLRTRYRSLPWGREEFVVLISSLLAIALTSLTVDKWLAIPLFLVAIAPLSVTAKVVKST